MKKITKWIVISMAICALAGSVLSAGFTQTVITSARSLEKKNLRNMISLSHRLQQVEAELDAYRKDQIARGEAESSPDQSVFRPIEESTGDVNGDGTTVETAAETAAEPDTAEESSTQASEETAAGSTQGTALPDIGDPIEPSPDTAPDAPTSDPAPLYVITEHEGIIGVFDRDGVLLRTLNVYVMTLPRADREALSVGIPIYSEAELQQLLDQYA